MSEALALCEWDGHEWQPSSEVVDLGELRKKIKELQKEIGRRKINAIDYEEFTRALNENVELKKQLAMSQGILSRQLQDKLMGRKTIDPQAGSWDQT